MRRTFSNERDELRTALAVFMVYGTFNLGLFVVLTVISARHVGPAIGFGLFAMLSIVRLRSQPIGNAELPIALSARGGGVRMRCAEAGAAPTRRPDPGRPANPGRA